MGLRGSAAGADEISFEGAVFVFTAGGRLKTLKGCIGACEGLDDMGSSTKIDFFDNAAGLRSSLSDGTAGVNTEKTLRSSTKGAGGDLSLSSLRVLPSDAGSLRVRRPVLPFSFDGAAGVVVSLAVRARRCSRAGFRVCAEDEGSTNTWN